MHASLASCSWHAKAKRTDLLHRHLCRQSLFCSPRPPAPCSTPSDCTMPPTSDSARDTTPTGTGAPPPRLRPTDYREIRQSTLGVFSLLLAFRMVNALALRTFFQPDEYFQSLEPAWELAFGTSSNAWVTWVNDLQQSRGRSKSHDATRSGERNCVPPCIPCCLPPSIEHSQAWRICVA